MEFLIKKIFPFIVILFFSVRSFAGPYMTVPVESNVYRAIDRLVAAGLVDNIIVGQRPYSSGEVQRIFAEAEKNIDRLTKPEDKMMVCRILRHFVIASGAKQSPEYNAGDCRVADAPRNDREWQLRFLDFLDINYDYLTGPDRALFANGLGSASTSIRPIAAYRGGRGYADGSNNSFETGHYADSRYFAFFARPRFQIQYPKGDNESHNGVFVENLYAKTGFLGLQIEAGRDEVIWGEGENGGLLFSNNARGLDFAGISNMHPVRLPYVGNLKASLLFANMGPHYSNEYAYLTAMKVSLQPADFVEAGINYSFIAGGKNAPDGAFRQGGVDFRFRIPPLSDMELYGEVYLQNTDWSNLGRSLLERTSYTAGIYLPRLLNSNNMALRFEFKELSPNAYRDNGWNSGFAIGGKFLGDALGPDARGYYASYYYDMGFSTRLIARVACEERRGDYYTAGSNGRYDATLKRPSEWRYRGMLNFEGSVGKITKIGLYFGYEAADNFNFIKGESKRSLIGGGSVTLDLNI